MTTAPPTVRICGLIPCFNNGDTVGDVVEALLAHLDAVIVVDDGSTGGGPGALPPREGLTVVSHDQNRGKGAAVRTGMEQARAAGFTHVLQMDADGQHDTDDISRFVEAARRSPRTLFAGERIWDDNAPRSSKFGWSFGMFWYHYETDDHPLTDTQCGFRMYPLELLDRVTVLGDRMEFDV